MPKQNVRRFNEPILAPAFLKTDGTEVGGGSAEVSAATTSALSGVTLNEDAAPAIRRMDLTFDDLGVAVANGNDVGSALVASLGSKNILILTIQSEDLVGTKDGTGAITSTQIDFGFGTGPAQSQTLGGNEVDIMQKLDFNEQVLEVDMSFNASTLSGTTVQNFPRYVAAGSDIYLNLYLNVGVDGTLTMNGTVTIFYMDLSAA